MINTDGESALSEADTFTFDANQIWSKGKAFDITYYLRMDEVDKPLAVYKRAVTRWYLIDQLRSLRDTMTNSDLAGRNDYSAFGIPLESKSDEPFFAGHEYDSAVNQYDYRTRWVVPAQGRFIQEDSLSFDGLDTNLFRLVNNSPANGRDVFGQKALTGAAYQVAAFSAVAAGIRTKALGGSWKDAGRSALWGFTGGLFVGLLVPGIALSTGTLVTSFAVNGFLSLPEMDGLLDAAARDMSRSLGLQPGIGEPAIKSLLKSIVSGKRIDDKALANAVFAILKRNAKSPL